MVEMFNEVHHSQSTFAAKHGVFFLRLTPCLEINLKKKQQADNK